ncbi:N-acetylmuramoyl-L-alanine amidase [Anseongella ginsenosidimutans]|uniref:N-acetylmuramoyl-L-alanine amidase n=1 Tax=Anseongella ginsenosidimutans TaxID=496056 RepID=A0A4R3KNI7_9SPHI|nr:N-acetylmuramoyl-L-alanine amidase [Anseongella ginsenosidimutans]QEC53688.1 N-acetylmuramoyl-L-alanine amidase [Anseongella ginsenosidimutans]TCS86063.1 N-acetylmuramoyl-L-alanine amidase [Anseongella ginsenosidimutans]
MKRILGACTLITLLISTAALAGTIDTTSIGKEDNFSGGYALKTVVLDAGHGGHDPGTNWAGVYEKHIALSITLKVGKLIKENMPDVKVIYTRDDDTFVELYERANIANRAHADLFISIHCNANNSTSPYGSETYTLGLHRTEDNFEVAKRENQVIYLEENYKENYHGFDPNSPESYIIFSLYQSQNMANSISLAARIQQEFKSAGRHNRGVKQAGFLVIRETSMPSVLVETGFVSNANERKFLNSYEGQMKMARSIYNAFKSYKTSVESAN